MVVGPLLPSSEFPETRAAAEAQAVRMARSVREAGDRAVIAPRADPDDDAVAGHESDRVLMDELPPFHRLPALLESVRDADAATAFRAGCAARDGTPSHSDRRHRRSARCGGGTRLHAAARAAARRGRRGAARGGAHRSV